MFCLRGVSGKFSYLGEASRPWALDKPSYLGVALRSNCRSFAVGDFIDLGWDAGYPASRGGLGLGLSGSDLWSFG